MTEAMLVRRRQVVEFEAGERTFTAADGLLGRLSPAILPISTVTSVRTTAPVVALTYDDGPDPASTPAVLDVLARAGVTATFFLLVNRAEQNPDLVARILDEGHEVGLHGQDHTRLSTLPATVAVARIRTARQRLETLTGRPVRLFRPAYGAQRLAQAVATRALGLEIVLWSAWARDWEAGTPAEIADRAAAAVHPGAILLLHDALAGASTAEEIAAGALDRAALSELLLKDLDAAGYQPQTVSALLDRHPAVRTLWFERADAARAAAQVTGAAPF